METLKAMTAKLGAPKLEGKEAVGGKDTPALYFGTTKINNNFDLVDAVGIQDGKGMTASSSRKAETNIFASQRVCQSPTAVVEQLGPFSQSQRLSLSKQAKRITAARYQFWERPT